MPLKDVLPKLRSERGFTQQDLANSLYVTRQAISRWETGETTPGIDMIKLLAVTLNDPIAELLEMPEQYCESCGMYLTDPVLRGTEKDGTLSEEYCKWCYMDGEYTYESTMEAMIDEVAGHMAESGNFTLDEATSLLERFVEL